MSDAWEGRAMTIIIRCYVAGVAMLMLAALINGSIEVALVIGGIALLLATFCLMIVEYAR